jgi:hypothetical protein
MFSRRSSLHCLLFITTVCSIALGNSCTAHGEILELLVANEHFSELPDGSFAIKNEPAAAEYLIGVIEGHVSNLIPTSFKDLVTASICQEERKGLMSSLAHDARGHARNLISQSEVRLKSKTFLMPPELTYETPLDPLASVGVEEGEAIYVCLHGKDLYGATVAKFDILRKEIAWQEQLDLGLKAIEGAHRCNTCIVIGKHEVAIVGLTETQVLVAFLSIEDGSRIDSIELSYQRTAK